MYRLGLTDYYLISAATGRNVPDLVREVMDFIEANPRKSSCAENEEVKFKWEDYHQQQLADVEEDDDDWDDD